MKLWTHHPAEFDLFDSSQSVDSSRGMYLRNEDKPEDAKNRFRYRELLPLIHERFGPNVLWCCLVRGNYPKPGFVEWEIDIPFEKVLFVNSVYWEALLRGTWAAVSEIDKGQLFLFPANENDSRKCVDERRERLQYAALCRFPVEGKLIRHGPLLHRYHHAEAYKAFKRQCELVNADLPGV